MENYSKYFTDQEVKEDYSKYFTEIKPSLLTKVGKTLKTVWEWKEKRETRPEPSAEKVMRSGLDYLRKYAYTPETQGRPIDILLENIKKGGVGLGLYPIEFLTGLKETPGIVGKAKFVGEQVKGIFADIPQQVLEEYSFATSPLATPEQRAEGQKRILEQPIKIFIATAIGKGLLKKGTAFEDYLTKKAGAEQVAKLKEAMPTEITKPSPEPTVTPPAPKLLPAEKIVPKGKVFGKAEMEMAKELRAKGVTTKLESLTQEADKLSAKAENSFNEYWKKNPTMEATGENVSPSTFLTANEQLRLADLGSQIERLTDISRGIRSTQDIKDIVQLKRKLNQANVKFPQNASKSQLIDLYNKARGVTEKPAPTEIAGKPKEPWEMTREEYRKEYIRSDYPYKDIPTHRKSVREALSEGKPVPPEVLADYPDLAKPTLTPERKAELRSQFTEIDNKLTDLYAQREGALITNRPKIDEQIRVLGEQKKAILVQGGELLKTEKVVDELYQQGIKAQKEAGQKGAVTIPAIKTPILSGILGNIKEKVKSIAKPFRFYPDAPPELRNAIRTQVSTIQPKIFANRRKLETAIFGGLDKVQKEQAVELVFARDNVARTKGGAGKPGVTVEEAMVDLRQIENSIKDQKVFKSADNWKTIAEEYRQDLIKRGKLDEGEFFEDYAPHFVEDYTPEWSPAFGIPSKMRRPWRGYTKKAVGTIKSYRQTPEALLDHLTQIEYHNGLEDFITSQLEKYDLTSTLSRDQKIKLFGVTKGGAVRPWARSGRIFDIEGKRYRAYSPDKPFTRQLFPTEEGLMAIGREKKTYLIPQNVYNTFEQFSERGNKVVYVINKVNAYGKSLAILSHYPGFTINNFVGDMYLTLLQHPAKIKFLREMDDGLRFLVKSPEKYNAFDTEFAKWVSDNAVVDATFIKELPHIYRSKNPLRLILEKAQEISQFRESIQRLANGRYLFKQLKEGKGDLLRQQWDWINTEGLSTPEALGKIARESFVDYQANSKIYNRWIRGLTFPFGTWYFKMSPLVWSYVKRHPIKAGLGLMALPVASTVYNNRSEKIRGLESKLSDDIRDGIHWTIGETPEGTIRVFNLQTPQDALIGTKIFSVATNQLNMVLNGEKNIGQGAKDTLKRWGIKEAKGLAYLTTPMVRFFRGLVNGRDPYDGQSIYPLDVSKLSSFKENYYRGLFFLKTFMPMLSGYISEEQGKVKPKSQAIKNVFDRFAGLPALGVRDYTAKQEMILPDGRKLDYETVKELQKIEENEASIVLDIKDNFIRSGVMPQEYYKSPEFQKGLDNLQKLHGQITPEMGVSLSKRITNQIEDDPVTLKMWVSNKLESAQTPEEKRYWRQILGQAKTWQMYETIKRKPVSIREHLPRLLEAKRVKE